MNRKVRGRCPIGDAEMKDYKWTFIVKGGPGSGNHGHSGRPGLVGGSSGGTGASADEFSGGGYKRTGFPGDSNQSQTAWTRGDGENRQVVGAYYSYGGKEPYRVHHGKPYKDSSYVVSNSDVSWDYGSNKGFPSGKEAAAYIKDRYDIDWDGEFIYSEPYRGGSPSRRMGNEQIAQAVARGELTPAQAARIKT